MRSLVPMSFAKVAALKLCPAPLAPTSAGRTASAAGGVQPIPMCPASSTTLTKFTCASELDKTYMLITESSGEMGAFPMTHSSSSSYHIPPLPQPLSQAPSSSKANADSMCEVNHWLSSHQY